MTTGGALQLLFIVASTVLGVWILFKLYKWFGQQVQLLNDDSLDCYQYEPLTKEHTKKVATQFIAIYLVVFLIDVLNLEQLGSIVFLCGVLGIYVIFYVQTRQKSSKSIAVRATLYMIPISMKYMFLGFIIFAIRFRAAGDPMCQHSFRLN